MLVADRSLRIMLNSAQIAIVRILVNGTGDGIGDIKYSFGVWGDQGKGDAGCIYICVSGRQTLDNPADLP